VGTETQFSRVEVAAVVAGISLGPSERSVCRQLGLTQ
jgi:hypothetical protein